MKAVVVGATGAVGSQLVEQLLQSNAWAVVATVGRRPVEVPATLQGKLQQTVINMDNLEVEGAPAFAGASTAFCTLGTQRGVAGSAEAFRKVDLVYVEQAAKAAKAAGVQHFSLVTAQTANSKQWANDMLPFHPLLYIKTKGQAEDAVRAQSFPRVTIFRPGLLLKAKNATVMEKVVW
ncbi:hypothetical protein WJX84_004524 [Apatococcus fuscideae]|uniref:NAD(P)-binding domain-containing protein n=1 Tax=Apatococcus fuscideae TaxID=2026836 RepID=A0AAW1T6G8_9CHLO